ncbi:MAG: methyltransferase, partial [Bacteroidales bacterium]|nr:methyltransferase [Bacteroidales bacterium]
NYPKYYDLIIDKLLPGGLIIADNVLWGGKVIGELSTNDKDTKGLLAFNKMVTEDKRVENVMLPLRDGLMLIRKK